MFCLAISSYAAFAAETLFSWFPLQTLSESVYYESQQLVRPVSAFEVLQRFSPVKNARLNSFAAEDVAKHPFERLRRCTSFHVFSAQFRCKFCVTFKTV